MRNARKQLSTKNLLESYLTARERIVFLGFGAEIDWQDDLHFAAVSEADFLREGAWVILSAGMRESVIRKKFEPITAAFMSWRSARKIKKFSKLCEHRAIKTFGHVGKIRAICALAERVASLGFSDVKRQIADNGIRYLQTFDFIGPVTGYHLAKNIGLDVVKPDRHLLRIADVAAFESPLELCRAISEQTGDRLAVIDLVLWRFATLEPRYLECFQGTPSWLRVTGNGKQDDGSPHKYAEAAWPAN